VLLRIHFRAGQFPDLLEIPQPTIVQLSPAAASPQSMKRKFDSFEHTAFGLNHEWD